MFHIIPSEEIELFAFFKKMTKKDIVKQIIDAFEKQDFSKVRSYFASDFVMDWAGILSVDNLDHLELFLKTNAPKRVIENKSEHFVENENLIFHSGETSVETQSGIIVKNYFCDIYQFDDDNKLKKITSYILHDK